MPIELTWMIPNTILLSRWIGDIVEEDGRVLVEELSIILDAADRPIHTVIDLTEAGDIAAHAVYVYIDSGIPTHRWRGRIGVVGASFQGKVLADIVNQVSDRAAITFFDSRDAARDHLLAHDTPPPDLASGAGRDVPGPGNTDPPGPTA